MPDALLIMTLKEILNKPRDMMVSWGETIFSDGPTGREIPGEISFISLLKKRLLLFSKDASNWSKVTVKTSIMLQKVSISNKCWSFELFIHYWILRIKVHHGFNKNMKQHNCFQYLKKSPKSAWFLKDHVTLKLLKISFASQISMKCRYFKYCNNISQVYCTFDQINAALVSRRNLFQHDNYSTDPNL